VLDSTQRCAEPDSEQAKTGPDISWVAMHPAHEVWDTRAQDADPEQAQGERTRRGKRGVSKKII
jgi:hypothetical protein